MTKLLNENFEKIAPICFFYDETNKHDIYEIGKKLRKSYLPFDKIDMRSFNNLNHLFADGVIGYGVHRFVHYVNKFANVFYYKFTYIGRHSLFKYPHDKPFGVHHVDDIQYVFTAKYVGPMIELTDPENIMVDKMTRIWEQFARSG